MVMGLSHYYGIKQKGVKEYGKEFFKPFWFMFPIKIIEEFANTLTLGFVFMVIFMLEKSCLDF